MIKDLIQKLNNKTDLSRKEMREIFGQIMSGAAGKSDIKDFLLALKEKGESVDEIVAAAEIMREKSVKVDVATENLIDTCGTGGAKIKDMNISTITAIVLSGCGIKVAKHGNRSFTGKCGSADLLEALGVKIDLGPKEISESIKKTGFGFMFAPLYHPAMKNVIEARKELKTKTIFNILGPLSNPAGAKMQLIGVYDEKLTEVMARALDKLGTKSALIVHASEGFDEISIKGKTKISELKDGKVSSLYVIPADFGIQERDDISGVLGGSPKENASRALAVLEGEVGAARDMVLINAAAALKMLGKAKNFKQGVEIARDAIDSKKAITLLRKLSNQ